MKQLVKPLVLCVALTLACPAWAQEQKPAAQPEAAEPAKPKAARKKTTVAKKSKRQDDARHCLRLPTNNEIIKCAEAYL